MANYLHWYIYWMQCIKVYFGLHYELGTNPDSSKKHRIHGPKMLLWDLLVCGRFEGDSSDFALLCIDNEVLWYVSLTEAKGKNQNECQMMHYHRWEYIPLKEVPWTKPEQDAQRLHHDWLYFTTTLILQEKKEKQLIK